MNCNQARTMLSAYRELKNEEIDVTELDEHLETCAACRAALASYTLIGEKMRSTSALEPPVDMHAKLMKALADEQLKFLQKSTPGKVSTPEFLKPYIQERAKEAQAEDDIAAFSTAETGPLPLLPARRKRRKVSVNQFAVLGLAASILILLMMGGLTSLLMFARSNPNSISKNSVSLARPAEVNQKIYEADTPYPNISSAIPRGNFVYYAASGTGETSNYWMLMQFNRSTKVSKPLLATAGEEPLIVLAASDTWLVWLEYDRALPTPYSSMPGLDNHHSPERNWSLHYLSLLPQPQSTTGSTTGTQATPTTSNSQQTTPTSNQGDTQQQPTEQVVVPTDLLLTQGIFDRSTAPSWVTGPLQGTWMIGDTLLVAQLDQRGVSHLKSYQLGETGKNARGEEIAKADAGHILTWPTANNTGTQLYWGEEWVSKDGVLHGNIWQRQESVETTSVHGYVKSEVSHTQKLLLNDGLSFQPQVVNNTLFFMSTSEVRISSQDRMEPNGTPLPESVIDPSVTFTARTDQRVYPALADTSLHGTIFVLPFDGPDLDSETMLGTVGQSTSFQAGDSYIVWKDNRGYRMYDVNRQAEVITGDTLSNASLLVVSGNTTLWLESNQEANKLTFMAYSWPN